MAEVHDLGAIVKQTRDTYTHLRMRAIDLEIHCASGEIEHETQRRKMVHALYGYAGTFFSGKSKGCRRGR